MDFIDEAKARGFFHQCTDEAGLRAVMAKQKIGGYIGFDATADSLHIGSLVQIMMLRLMQRHGHKAHLVIGGATTRIGDPSFRDAARALISPEQIGNNVYGIRKVFDQFFDRASGVVMHDNFEWFQDVTYLDILREVGPHFSINRMLSFDSVKTRLDREQGLSFLEFNYAIMQAYDFRFLVRTCGKDWGNELLLQMGGSDQWANIVSGIDLIRKTDQKTVYGLTAPLIIMSNGEKMGKSAGGAVWLSKGKLSPYDYWQFWRNVSDADVGKFLRLFTELDLGHIAELEALQGSDINAAKIILANEATRIAHGVDESQRAATTARETFHGNEKQSDDLPKFLLNQEQLNKGVRVVDLFVWSGMTESIGAARRLIHDRGARLNDTVIIDENMMIYEPAKLSAGKKRHVLIRSALITDMMITSELIHHFDEQIVAPLTKMITEERFSEFDDILGFVMRKDIKPEILIAVGRIAANLPKETREKLPSLEDFWKGGILDLVKSFPIAV